MTNAPGSQTSARIVVGLGPSLNNEAALRVALSFAKAAGGKVLAVFIEETDAIHAADYPFARTTGQAGGPPQAVASGDMRRALERQIKRCSKLLQTAADRERLDWSFIRETGDLTAAISGQLKMGDTLVLLRDMTSAALTLRANLLTELARPDITIVVGTDAKGEESQTAVAVLDEKSDHNAVLNRAVALNRTRHPLQVITLADDAATARRLGRAADDHLSGIATHARVTTCPTDRRSLIGFLNRSGASFACFGSASPFLKNPADLHRFALAAAPRIVVVPTRQITENGEPA